MESERLVLLDTSVVIDFLRDSKTPWVDEVQSVIANGLGAWCDMVKLEIWAGAKGQREKMAIADLDEALTMLETTSEVWKRAHSLAIKRRSAGLTMPAPDILICATAIEFNCNVLSRDGHITAALEKFNRSK